MPHKKIKRWYDNHKTREVVSAVTAVIVIGGYFLGNQYPIGWFSYAALLPALLGVIFTVLARVNDIDHTKTGWSWQARRIALTIVGATAAAYIYSPFSANPVFPTWLAVMSWWGFFLTWLTTPSMPPWHKYVFGDAPAVEPKQTETKDG